MPPAGCNVLKIDEEAKDGSGFRTYDVRMSKRAVAWVVAVASLCAVLAAVPGCDGGSTPSSPSDSREQLTVKLTTAHFEVRADRAPGELLNHAAGQLEANYDRITSDLRVVSLARTSVWVWQDRDSFYADMGTRGPVYYGAGGYVVNGHTVSLLVVPAASAAEFAREAVHEFAHVVSMAVNPSIPNNPRWLWETVAQYESGSFIHPTTLDYMRAGRYPSITDLDAAWNTSSQVYQVGYVLGEYIVARWGQDGLVRLIRLNGDIPGALGVAAAEFESGWRAFLHERYGLPAGSGLQS